MVQMVFISQWMEAHQSEKINLERGMTLHHKGLVVQLALDNPNVSGARPILNTTQGGTQAAPGVFGSKEGFYETVSSSSGGGNPYIFDTRGTQPTLSFIRGATYVF